MLAAYRVREHNKTGQTIKQKENKTQRTESLLKIAVRETSFRQSFTSPLQGVVPGVLVHDPPSIFQDRITNIPQKFHVYHPHKRNVDALLKVGVIIKVEAFRTRCCSVLNALLCGCKNCAGCRLLLLLLVNTSCAPAIN